MTQSSYHVSRSATSFLNDHKEKPLMQLRIKFKQDLYINTHVYKDDTS